jgi:hypothetical protein
MPTPLPLRRMAARIAWRTLFLAAFAAAPGCSKVTEAPDPAPTVAEQDAAPAKKRAAPPKVRPVEHAGVRYTELRGGRGRGLEQSGGYIVAEDMTDDKELWIAKIYDSVGDGDMEADKTDVYIVKIELDSSQQRLLITNERKERYALSLRDRTVVSLGR